MYWVITIMLMFHGTDNEKMTLLEQHIEDYGDALKSFELFCENRYGQEV